MRKGDKSGPKQVTKCEQYCVPFQACDTCVVKATGECQHYNKNRRIIKFPAITCCF